MYHRTNSLGALNMKTGEKLESTILAASTAYQESRLGTISGKGYYSLNVRVDGLGATCSSLGLLPGAAYNKGMLDFLSEEKTTRYVLYETTTGATGLLPGTRRRNHPTSRPPIKSTGQYYCRSFTSLQLF